MFARLGEACSGRAGDRRVQLSRAARRSWLQVCRILNILLKNNRLREFTEYQD